jgi:histidinol-phosphatase (PHP family)
MFDFHIHSAVSFDGNDSIDSIAGVAAESGLLEICFCEHIEPAHTYDIDWDGYVDFEEYTRQIESARAKYPQLKICQGIEAGLDLSSIRPIGEYLRANPVDFVIASQHMVAGEDPYFPTYFEGKTKEESEALYLKYLLDCIRQFDAYSVVGHIGYVSQHSPHNRPLSYADYPDLIDEILKTAIHSGKGIEVNTNGYYKYGEPMPAPAIIRRFLELGGEILTIGSDAHYKSVVGAKYAEVESLLVSLGARYVCTFHKMQPVFHKIEA